VIEGLEGASAAAGKLFDKAAMEQTLAGLTTRVFVMNNVHDDHPIVFESRFVMSYLAGPLTRTQIATLTKKPAQPTITAGAARSTVAAAPTRPVVPGGLAEKFIAGRSPLEPHLVGKAKAHYALAKADIDVWRELTVEAPLSADTAGDFWEHAQVIDPSTFATASEAPPEGAAQSPLPRALDAKSAGQLDDGLAAWVFREGVLRVSTVKSLGVVSKPDETEPAFRARVAMAVREQRDAAIDKLRAKYRPRLEALESKQRTAEDRVAREQAQASAATTSSAISIGASVLGALFGGRRGSVGKVASAARSVSRTASQRDDVTRARASADAVSQQHAELEAELQADIAALQAEPEPEIETIELKAKKADTAVTSLAIVWR
jgi:hypothetical protein